MHTNGNTHRQHALKALRFEIREIPQHRSQPPAYRHLPDPSRSSPAALTAQIGSSGSGGQSRGPPGAADPSGGLRPGSPRRRPPLSRPPPPLPGGRHDEQPGRGPSLPSRPTPTWSASLSTAILLLRHRSSRAHAAPATGGARAPRPAPLLLLLRPQLRSAPLRAGGAGPRRPPRLASPGEARPRKRERANRLARAAPPPAAAFVRAATRCLGGAEPGLPRAAAFGGGAARARPEPRGRPRAEAGTRGHLQSARPAVLGLYFPTHPPAPRHRRCNCAVTFWPAVTERGLRAVEKRAVSSVEVNQSSKEAAVSFGIYGIVINGA